MFTFTKTKIGIISLVLASFVIGGFAFNAFQVGAFGSFHRFGFFGGGCDLSGLEKDSPEWQTKVDECKAEKEAKMEEFKATTPEERQEKIEELRANWPQHSELKRRGFGFGHFMGLKGFRGISDEVDYTVVNIADGVQITITSDNSDIVTKLQESAARFNSSNE